MLYKDKVIQLALLHCILIVSLRRYFIVLSLVFQNQQSTLCIEETYIMDLGLNNGS